jgi:hypothetical protein
MVRQAEWDAKAVIWYYNVRDLETTNALITYASSRIETLLVRVGPRQRL